MKTERLILPFFAAIAVALAQETVTTLPNGRVSIILPTGEPPGATNGVPPGAGVGGPATLTGPNSNVGGGTGPNLNNGPVTNGQTGGPTQAVGTGSNSVQANPTSIPVIPTGSNPTTNANNPVTTVVSNGGNKGVLTGLTILFAILFAIALAAAIFLFIKRRQDKRQAYVSPSYSGPEGGAYSDKGANAQIEALQTQLADANKRLTAVQGSLLAAGQKPQTKDDTSLSREYTQINTDIVGWAGNYFKASSDPINLTTELYEFLTEHVPNYQSLLTSGKSKQLVVRAIVSQVLQESFENGAFFGSALAGITPLIRTSSAPPTAMNNWRSETFFLLEKSDDFASQRRAAVSTITDRIEQLTYPLAATKQTPHGDTARYKFLEGIVKKAGDFALALGKQRANFQVLSEPAGCEFGHATMDDVSQQTDITRAADGSTSHPLEGRPIQATIFPLLLKYGNESGEAYDQITILSNAKVLV
ncbi:hypothetical protein Dda_6141 [Drechslerella dactyloides]|uniref:Uncharacterized protein n=1 Tax=Drechslerella dactyloides TaxID=74499 RepID=A0AAD6IZH8_DREDA|nr:hypothetical protein Dda_6141 [Drechslerella dactyloides]